MKTKLHVSGTLLIISTWLLAACTPATPTPTAAPQATQAQAATSAPDPTTATEPTTIKFACWEGDLGQYDDVVAKFIEPFTAQTGIQVEYEVAPWPDYWNKLNTLAATAEMPDVYCQSVAYAWDHAKNGVAADLSFLEAELNRDDYIWETTQNLGTRYPDANGSLYAMPFRFVSSFVFYNKDLFDAAGVPYPTDDWTYADMVEIAKQLTVDADGDDTPEQWGWYVDGSQITYDSMVKANGGRILNDAQTECLADQGAGVEALQLQVDLIQKHKVAPPPGGLDLQGVHPLVSGKFAMVQDITPAINFLQDVDFEWGIVLPPIGSEKRAIYGGPDPISVSANSAHPEAAAELIKFLLSAEIQNDPAILGSGSFPFNRPVAESEAFLGKRGNPANLGEALNHMDELVDADFGSHWIEWRFGAMDPEIKAALLGEKTPEAALTDACAAVDQVLAEK